jgi:hypothetical protein
MDFGNSLQTALSLNGVSPTIGTGSGQSIDFNYQKVGQANFTLGRIGVIRSDGADNRGSILFFVNKAGTMIEAGRFNYLGQLGIGITAPTAFIHLKAGTATAGTAPQKYTSGTLLSAPEVGAWEFLTDDLYFTITTGAARKGLILNDGTNLTSGQIPYATTNGRLTGQTPLSGTKVYYVSDTSGGTVNRKLTFINGILTAET